MLRQFLVDGSTELSAALLRKTSIAINCYDRVDKDRIRIAIEHAAGREFAL